LNQKKKKKTKQKNTKANPRTEPVASQNPPNSCFGQETPELRTPRTLGTKAKITAKHMHAHAKHQSSNQNEEPLREKHSDGASERERESAPETRQQERWKKGERKATNCGLRPIC
jgi:hypothetical protein